MEANGWQLLATEPVSYHLDRMKLCLKFCSILSIALLGVSCSTPIKPSDAKNIKTVGIINKLPEYPTFTKLETTVFTSKVGKVQDPQFHAYASSVLIDCLKAKGMIAREIADDSAARNNVDLVLVLEPWFLVDMPETYGYGVTQRSALGIRGPSLVYVAIVMKSYRHGKRMTDTVRQKMNKLHTPLSDSYASMPDCDKERLRDLLRKQILESITEFSAWLLPSEARNAQ